METEVTAEAGKVNFCGVVFGKKSESSFHAFIYFPPRGTGAATGTAYVDFDELLRRRPAPDLAPQSREGRSAAPSVASTRRRPRCGIGCAST